MWQRDTSGDCSNVPHSGSISPGSTSYNIMGLEEDSSYTITVAATNAAGSSTDSVTEMTPEAGER